MIELENLLVRSLSYYPRFPGALAFLVPSLSWCPRFPGALAFLLPSLPPVLIGDGGGEPAGGPLLSSIACAVKFLGPSYSLAVTVSSKAKRTRSERERQKEGEYLLVIEAILV
jgi:hypothetical protein